MRQTWGAQQLTRTACKPGSFATISTASYTSMYSHFSMAAANMYWVLLSLVQHEADPRSTTVDQDSLQAWKFCHHLYCLLHKHLYVLCRIVQHMHQLRCDWCHIYSHAQVPLSLTQASSAHQLKLARHVCLSHVLLQLLLRFYQFGSDTDTLAIQCESHS